ncbi:uncharacterized protein LOC120333726 [Styela clava]
MFPASLGQGHQPMSLKAIDEIPHQKRKNICTFIDYSITLQDGYWELLVTELGFNETDSKNFLLAFAKKQSPTDNLLRECGYRNYKIVTLSHVLKKIGLVKLVAENLENLEEISSPVLPNAQYGFGGMHFYDKPRRPTESDSSSSSHSGGTDVEKIGGIDTTHHSYADIKKGTKNFASEMKLGAGAFGKVYKVVLKNTVYACKVLTMTTNNTHMSLRGKYKGNTDLRNELRYLADYRHPHIVPLYGWSVDGDNPCLIYEYMKNGSLQDCLQRLREKESLSWLTRLNVACGAARGLRFLHEEKSKPLIHGDIKTANILLGDSYHAKLGDFGLAREGPSRHKTGSYIDLGDEHTPGTIGYLAPEYLQSKKLSVEVDTYAFGVVLHELYTGRRAFDRNQKRAVTLLRDYMDDLANGLGRGGLEGAEDRLFEHQSPELERLPRIIALRFVRLALGCCHERRNKRPSMLAILTRLEAICADIKMLPKEQVSDTSSTDLTPNASITSNKPQLGKPSSPNLRTNDMRYDTRNLIPVESEDPSLVMPSQNIESSIPHKNSDIYAPPGVDAVNEALKQLELKNSIKSNSEARSYTPSRENSVFENQKPNPIPSRENSVFEGYTPQPHISIPQYFSNVMYHHPHAAAAVPVNWDPSGHNMLPISPVFSMWPPQMPHNIPVLGPYSPYVSGPSYPTQGAQQYGQVPFPNTPDFLGIPSGMDQNDPSDSKPGNTPVSPSTPGLVSTPEPFDSLELNQPLHVTTAQSPQVSNPFTNSNINGGYSNLPPSNPFHISGGNDAHFSTPQQYDQFSPTSKPEAENSHQRSSTSADNEGISPPRTYSVKVSGPKASLLDNLDNIEDEDLNLSVSHYFSK